MLTITQKTLRKAFFVCSMVIFSAILGLAAVPSTAQATPISYEEVIFESGSGLESSQLSGTIDMTYNSSQNYLTIVLTNTSGLAGATLSQNLLTGIGFNLPTGMMINTTGSHQVSLTSGSAISPSGSLDNTKWGYGNPATSGPFLSLPSGQTVNTDLGTVQSMITNDLNNTATPPANVQGPNFGMLSDGSSFTACTGGLQCAISSLTFRMYLSGSYTGSGTLLNYIDSNHVALAFGSPNVTQVPEPSAFLLLGVGLLALGFFSRFNGWLKPDRIA
jgi:hypothetical protein